jgi:hypothetical protein
LAFRHFLANFEQGSILVGIFTPVNGEFKLLGKFGRCFIVRMDRLRNSSISSSNRGLSSSVKNHFLLNFGSGI